MPSKKKKQTKSKKVAKRFNPRSPAGGLLVFSVIFAVIGGGYMLYKSLAASYPPDSLTHLPVDFGKKNSSDGVVVIGRGPITIGHIWCNYTTSASPYGGATSCIEFKPDDGNKARFGSYNYLTKLFYPVEGAPWNPVDNHTDAALPSKDILKCGNMDNYFQATFGNYFIAAPYGVVDVAHGQIFRTSGASPNGWQVAWANYVRASKACTLLSSWMNVSAAPTANP